jgi:hypothetical protein
MQMKKYTTTGKRAFAVCHKVCRGQNIGHTAKARFAVCQEKRLTAKVWHTANAHFAVCLETQPMANNCHTAKIEFAVCFFCAHGKDFSKKIKFGLHTFSGISIQYMLLHVKHW